MQYPYNLDDWQPDKAVAEAEHDISAGTLKIYIGGTIALSPVGISSEHLDLIEGLPTAYADVGCVIEDPELRRAQHEYARRYNGCIIQHLSKRQAQQSNVSNYNRPV